MNCSYVINWPRFYALFDNANCTGSALATLTTGNNGYSETKTIGLIDWNTTSYTLYCKEYSVPNPYIADTNTKYNLTWYRSNYEALKNNGDETGELQTFGGSRGIVNLTITPTPTTIITPAPTDWKIRYQVKKVNTNGQPLANATFKVYDNADCTGNPIATLTTGSNGLSEVKTIDTINWNTTSYKLYCKEDKAPDGYVVDKNKVYDLTWTRSTYESLKNNGDETGELQIFGGNDGIVNVTPTSTPTVTPTPAPTDWKIRYQVKKVNANGQPLAKCYFQDL